MGLITCRDCKKEVSDRALACPGCGAPLATANASASGAGTAVARSGPSKVTRMVALLAAFGLLILGLQVLYGAALEAHSKEWSGASVITLSLMIGVFVGCPAALYIWAVRKPR